VSSSPGFVSLTPSFDSAFQSSKLTFYLLISAPAASALDSRCSPRFARRIVRQDLRVASSESDSKSPLRRHLATNQLSKIVVLYKRYHSKSIHGARTAFCTKRRRTRVNPCELCFTLPDMLLELISSFSSGIAGDVWIVTGEKTAYIDI
jgi:hypothetical protein